METIIQQEKGQVGNNETLSLACFLQGKYQENFQKLNQSDFKRAIIQSILDTVNQSHKNGDIIGNLHPRKIELDYSGKVTLIDNLDAKSNQDDTSLYCSPEQLLKKSCDQKTDIWSVGMMIYALLIKKPFSVVKWHHKKKCLYLDQKKYNKLITHIRFSQELLPEDQQTLKAALSLNPEERPCADKLLTISHLNAMPKISDQPPVDILNQLHTLEDLEKLCDYMESNKNASETPLAQTKMMAIQKELKFLRKQMCEHE